jgi:hypothetical protein
MKHTYTDGLTLDSTGLWRMANGQIWVPDDTAVRSAILHECHDANVAGHPGRDRTLELVLRHFWWPTVREDVIEYVDGCEYCQTNKSGDDNRKTSWLSTAVGSAHTLLGECVHGSGYQTAGDQQWL